MEEDDPGRADGGEATPVWGESIDQTSRGFVLTEIGWHSIPSRKRDSSVSRLQPSSTVPSPRRSANTVLPSGAITGSTHDRSHFEGISQDRVPSPNRTTRSDAASFTGRRAWASMPSGPSHPPLATLPSSTSQATSPVSQSTRPMRRAPFASGSSTRKPRSSAFRPRIQGPLTRRSRRRPAVSSRAWIEKVALGRGVAS